MEMNGHDALCTGAKVNLQDECGETPLHVALAAEQEELISILIEAGADTSLKNSEGNSCADLLKEEEHRYAATVTSLKGCTRAPTPPAVAAIAK